MIPISLYVAAGIALKQNQDNAKRMMKNNYRRSLSKHETDVYPPVPELTNNDIKDIENMREMTKNLMKILGVDIDNEESNKRKNKES